MIVGVRSGQTTNMWRKAVAAAQDNKRVLVCVHDRKMISEVTSIPLEDGKTALDYAGKVTETMLVFYCTGRIKFHTPGALLTGQCFEVIAIDHHARFHFSIAEWEDSIRTRLEPNGEII